MTEARMLRAIRPPDGTDEEGEYWLCAECHEPTAAGDCIVALDNIIRCFICDALYGDNPEPEEVQA